MRENLSLIRLENIDKANIFKPN